MAQAVDNSSPNRRQPKSFEMFVKTLTGKTITLDLTEESSVLDLKLKIFYREDIPYPFQRLVIGGRQLDNNNGKVGDYGIKFKATVHLSMRMTYEIILQCKNPTFFDKRFGAENIKTFDDLKQQVLKYFSSIGIKNDIFDKYSLYYKNEDLLKQTTTLKDVWNENNRLKMIVQIRNDKKEWFAHKLAR